MHYRLVSGVQECGLVAGNFSISKKEEKQELIEFEDQLSEMLRIAVFTLLGAQVTLLLGLQDFILILLFFMLVVLLRPLILLILMGDLKKKFTRKDVLLMSFIAPRGLSAAAMIPIIAAAVVSIGATALADKMINIVFMVILLSVLFSTIVAGIGSMKRFQDKKEKDKKEKKPEDDDGKPGKESGEKEETGSVERSEKADETSETEKKEISDKGPGETAKKEDYEDLSYMVEEEKEDKGQQDTGG